LHPQMFANSRHPSIHQTTFLIATPERKWPEGVTTPGSLVYVTL
jgi:hypothetical protein